MKHVLGASSLGCYCGDDDYVVLEDEGGRMTLRGACLPVQELVTGEALAATGGRGVFHDGDETGGL